jgi:lipopolysaccharide/colanic/teichoic acid biosynthesis glycosyltransferase
MTFVGPRPCLPTQHQLIDERAKRGLFTILPGLTGPAQIRKIDMAAPVLMAQVEEEYFAKATLMTDLAIVWRTLFGAGRGDVIGVK